MMKDERNVFLIICFFTLNFSSKADILRFRLGCAVCSNQKKQTLFFSCAVSCVHTKPVKVLPGRQNSGQKYKDFTHALVPDDHAEWPK